MFHTLNKILAKSLVLGLLYVSCQSQKLGMEDQQANAHDPIRICIIKDCTKPRSGSMGLCEDCSIQAYERSSSSLNALKDLFKKLYRNYDERLKQAEAWQQNIQASLQEYDAEQLIDILRTFDGHYTETFMGQDRAGFDASVPKLILTPSFHKALNQAILDRIGEFEAQALVDIIMVYARMQLDISEDFFTSWQKAILPKLAALAPPPKASMALMDIMYVLNKYRPELNSNFIEAWKKSWDNTPLDLKRSHRRAEWVVPIARYCTNLNQINYILKQLEWFSPKELIYTMESFSNTVPFPKEFTEKFKERVKNNLSQFQPNELIAIMQVAVHLGQSLMLPQPFYDSWKKIVLDRLEVFTAPELTSLIELTYDNRLLHPEKILLQNDFLDSLQILQNALEKRKKQFNASYPVSEGEVSQHSSHSVFLQEGSSRGIGSKSSDFEPSAEARPLKRFRKS